MTGLAAEGAGWVGASPTPTGCGVPCRGEHTSMGMVAMEQSQGFLSKAPLTWNQLWARRVTLHEMAPLYRAPRAITSLTEEVGIMSCLRGEETEVRRS